MIELKPGVLYHSVLLVALDGPAGDFMGMLSTNDGEKQAQFVGRFRWYYDDKVFDSEDHKKWLHIVLPEGADREKFLEAFLKILAHGPTSCAGQVLEIDGDYKKAMKILTKHPWFSMKRVGAPEPVEGTLTAEA